MPHLNDGIGKAICGSESTNIKDFAEFCGCSVTCDKCIDVVSTAMIKIDRLQQLEKDEANLSNLLYENNYINKLTDAEINIFRERLTEIENERKSNYPSNFNESYIMSMIAELNQKVEL